MSTWREIRINIRQNNFMRIAGLLFVCSLLIAAFTGIAMSEELKGRILGEKCAQLGKVGECYLKWADPMVFWTEEGDYYQIELKGKDLDQVTLDKAFGLEVQVKGKIIDEERIQIASLKVLNPPGKKEFFKG